MNYWKDEYAYKRILEVLNDYWLSEKNEAGVRVEMRFVHRNGDTQVKNVSWFNFGLSDEEKVRAALLLQYPE